MKFSTSLYDSIIILEDASLLYDSEFILLIFFIKYILLLFDSNYISFSIEFTLFDRIIVVILLVRNDL